MKAKSLIFAAAAAILLTASCSVFKGASSSASTSGSSVGAAIASIYANYKKTGKLDLSNLSNILDLATILGQLGTLANATNSFADEFSAGLVEGSQNLINSKNVAPILASLKSMAEIDSAAILSAASAAADGTVTQLSTSNQNVSAAVNALTNIFKQLK